MPTAEEKRHPQGRAGMDDAGKAAAEICDATAEMLEVFEGLIESEGITHDDSGCPEDDTCTCENVKKVNDSAKRVRLALRGVGW